MLLSLTSCQVFSEADIPPILRRFKVVTSDELPPPEVVEQAETEGEDDVSVPQELLQLYHKCPHPPVAEYPRPRSTRCLLPFTFPFSSN